MRFKAVSRRGRVGGQEVCMDGEIWAFAIGLIAAVLLGIPAIGFFAYWFMRLFRFGWGLAAGL